eukprot:UN03753
MAEWEKYVNNKFVTTIRKSMLAEEKSEVFKSSWKSASQSRKKCSNGMVTNQIRGQLGKLAVWIENRLEVQDEILEALRIEVLEIKNEIASLLIESEDKQAKHLQKEILRIESQVSRLSVNMNKDSDEKELSEQEKVEKWFEEKIKLSQYCEVFIEQGFDSLEVIMAITKEDLIAMGIDKVGHQRKILKNAKEI